MPNTYTNRDLLKQAMGIDASSTGNHLTFDSVLETVSRMFDDYVGFPFFASSGTRYFTPKNSQQFDLPEPVLAIDSVRADLHGTGTSWDTTMTSSVYNLTPYNAAQQSPPRPYWGMELRYGATMAFPTNWPKALQIIGT